MRDSPLSEDGYSDDTLDKANHGVVPNGEVVMNAFPHFAKNNKRKSHSYRSYTDNGNKQERGYMQWFQSGNKSKKYVQQDTKHSMSYLQTQQWPP